MDSITINTSGSLDVAAIVSALMEVEQVPMQRLAANAQGVRSTISEIGRLQSAMSAFQDTARNLKDAATWQSAAGVSSDETAVGISATSGALQGSYAVTVNQLASHQTIVSPALGDRTTVLGGGTINVQMSSPGAESVAIEITAGSTLEQVSAAINAADAGVGSSLVTDSAGTRLMIRSSESGAEQAFELSVTGDGSGPGVGLGALSYTAGQTGGSMTRTQEAANALFELNGLALESATNRPDGVLENVGLSFNSVTEEAVELDIVSDAEAIREQVDAFVAAYNELNSLIKSQTRYDGETQTAGPLQGNRTVLLIQERMRDILRTTLPENETAGSATDDSSSRYTRLSDVGLEVQRDGSLSINESRFDVAMTVPGRLQAMFGGTETDENPGSDGFARRFDSLMTDLLGVDGAITGATETLRRREDLIESQQDSLDRRLVDIEERLIRQYTSLDANMARMNGALQSVSQLL